MEKYLPEIQNEISLPDIIKEDGRILDELISAIGVPRTVIASNEQIYFAWQSLPRAICKIPTEYRNGLIARMCIAVKTGLFDSAINYAWNTAVLSLRNKLINFGLQVASEMLDIDLSDKKLLDITDASLLKYCLELNLISEDGNYFLSQCRDLRNNYSAAHPVSNDEVIDDTELINFITRCTKYAFDTSNDPQGVEVKVFFSSLKSGKLNEESEEYWVNKITQTNQNQRAFIFKSLYTNYCDSSNEEMTRLNCIKLSKRCLEEFTPNVYSILINQHQEYILNDKQDKIKASQLYFEKLGLIKYLDESEKHSIISRACKLLLATHNAFDNFHNEPPFAERLYELSLQGAIPNSTKYEFVEIVTICAIGNCYGTSNLALPFYKKMISGFNQAEIKIMLGVYQDNSLISRLIKEYPRCKAKYKDLVSLISLDSIPSSLKSHYEKILKHL